MSQWTFITGTIRLASIFFNVTEDRFLDIYSRYSHALVGSEGGLNINFNRTQRKNFYSSTESHYHVENLTRLDTVTLYGDLRDFDPSDIDGAVCALKDFLAHLNKSNIIENATFLIESNSADHYHTIVFAKGRVRSQKIVVKANN